MSKFILNRHWQFPLIVFILHLFIYSTQAETSSSSHVEEASPIFYETSLARTFSAAAAGKQLHKGCLYNKQKFQSGDEVPTPQPCLRCVCGRKGVLMCALRICPPVTGNFSIGGGINGGGSSNQRCQVVREANTCCPKVQCLPATASAASDLSANDRQQTAEHAIIASNEIKSIEKSVTTVTPLITLESSLFTVNRLENREGGNKSGMSEENAVVASTGKGHHMVSVTHLPQRNTTILQTVPSSSFPDKERIGGAGSGPVPHLALHAQGSSPESYVADLLNGFGKNCYVNGTFYAEGSAIASSSFCEYCYCIRGKRMCIRPRCHLSILGCLPRYSSEFACCPTSYACGTEALSTSKSNTKSGATNGKWSLFYALDDKLALSNGTANPTSGTLVNEFEAEGGVLEERAQVAEEMTTITGAPIDVAVTVTDAPTTTTTTTTTTSTTLATTTTLQNNSTPLGTHPRMTDCVFDSVSYKVGEFMPSDIQCAHCYCAANGQRSCKAIQCSLLLEDHCTPVIPEGHCCPSEYKCDDKKGLDSSTSLPTLTASSEKFESTVAAAVAEGRDGEALAAPPEENEPPVTTSDLVTSTTEPVLLFNMASNERITTAVMDTTTLTPAVMMVSGDGEKGPSTEKAEQPLVFSLLASSKKTENSTSSNSTATTTATAAAVLADNSNLTSTVSTTDEITKEVGAVNGIVNEMTSALGKTAPAAAATTTAKSFTSSSGGNALEARNLADKPQLTAFTNELGPISVNNGTAGNAIKLENVANFLSNFFNVLGLTGKTATTTVGVDSRGTPVEEDDGGAVGAVLPLSPTTPAQQLPPVPNSVMLVEDDSHLLPALVFASTGDQVEIITAQPPSQAQAHYINGNHFEGPKKVVHSGSGKAQELVVGASMTSGQVSHHTPHYKGHVETMKSLRDLPFSSSNLSKNVPLDKGSSPKGHTFSNGWRAIPNLKHKQRPPIDRPLFFADSKKVVEESGPSRTESLASPSSTTVQTSSATPSTTTTTTTTTTSTTTAKPEVTSDASNNHNLGTSQQPTDISKAKCIFEGKEYENNAILPKSTDPCVYCRCFYGKEICQEQKCPSPPSLGCVAERVANQCCPVYTCRLGGATQNESSTVLERSAAPAEAAEKSHFRKGPQFMPDHSGQHQQVVETAANSKPVNSMEDQQHSPLAKSRFDGEPLPANIVSPPSPLPLNRQAFGPPHPNQPPPPPPRISFPFDTMGIRPMDLAYGTRLAENRIHFPQKNKLPNNLPPGVILQPNPHLQNPILNLHKPLLNRPLFPSHPPPHHNGNHFKHQQHQPQPQHHQPHQHQQQHNKPLPMPAMDDIRGHHSQIRPLPQSPMQLENGGILNNTPEQSNMNPKPRPPQVAPTESAVPSTTEAPMQHSTAGQQPSGPWDILQVSGCNIYGKMYKTGEEVGQLSTDCKKCICSPQGVQCRIHC